MPKFMRIFVLTLALAVTAALFAGCWGSDGTETHSEPQPPASVSRPEASKPQRPEKPESAKPHSGGTGMPDASKPESVQPDAEETRSQIEKMMKSGVADAAFSDAGVFAGAQPDDAWMTRLVNAQHPLPEDFTVETAGIEGYDSRLFDKRAAPQLQQMLHDAEQAGCKLYLVSAYRSIARQDALFRRKTAHFRSEGLTQEEAERQAAQWVARPGTSEHNTGLAADIVCAGWYETHDDLTAEFAKTAEFEWLMAHCAEYGFILRYPLGKESVTGITFEPWHYRYVGTKAAARMAAEGLTLEEYTRAQAAAQ